MGSRVLEGRRRAGIALIASAALLAAGWTQAVHASTGADVAAAKTASVATVPAGGSYTYTMVVSNVGTASATDVRLVDRTIEPDVLVNLSSLSWSPAAAGSCTWSFESADPNNLTCSFGTLAPGASVTVTLQVTAPAATCPRVRNTMSVSASNEPLANTGNNSSVVNVSMTGCPSATPTPSASVAPTPPPSGSGPTVARLFGADRYETAVKLSVRRHPSPGSGVSAVYVATGTSFPDALAGGPAAARRGASILLVKGTSIPTTTRNELLRLKSATIYVLGGPGAISDAVATGLKPLTRNGSGSVVRLWGSDRYGTAAAVVNNAFASAGTVLVATGQNFPDALAGSAAGARHGMPILLVKQGEIPAAAAQQLRELRPTRIYVLGGTAVIKPAVEQQLRSFGATVVRIAGADRYLTATGIIRTFFGPARHAFVATGVGFPDALAAGPLADPVLLTAPQSLPTPVAAEATRLNPSSIHVLGGPTVVSEAVLAQLRAT